MIPSTFIHLGFNVLSQELRTQAGRRVLFIGPLDLIQQGKDDKDCKTGIIMISHGI